MNKTFFLPLIIIFFSLYYFLFPVNSSTEMIWTAAYSEALTGLGSSELPIHDTVVFNQGIQKAAVRADSGKIFLSEPGFQGYLSSTHLIYKSDDTLYLEEFGSYPFAVAKTSGTALVLGERYFSIDYSSAYIEEYDISGRSLWFWRGLAPITALAWNNEYIAVGSLDGTVKLINTRGDIINYPAAPPEGDHVVYGAVLSGDSSRISIVSGLRNQTLRTYSISEYPELISQIELESHFRRPVKMYYSRDAVFLWVEQEEGILQITENEAPLVLPVEDTFLTMIHDREGQLVYILSRQGHGTDDSVYILKSLSPEGKLLFESRTDYIPYSLQLSASDLAISMNSNLMLLSREEK